MLEALRKSASGFVAKLFIGLLVLSFGIWGVADIFRGYRGTDVAEVGDTPITIEEYRSALQREIQGMSRQLGSYLTMDQARQYGVDRRVLSRLMAQAALDDEARSRGLGITDAVIADSIQSDPGFQTPAGQFDPSYFAQVLRASGYSEALYVAVQRKQLLREMIADAVGGGLAVPDVLKKAIARYQNETRSAEYLVITPAMVGDIPEPTEEELRTYFDENKVDFRAPEYRKVGVLDIEPVSLATDIEVSEEDARNIYDRDPGSFGTPERRAIERIVFDTLDEARAARQEIDDGKTFEEVADERGMSETDRKLGTLTRDGILDPAIADAAFGLEIGEVSDPVEGTFAPALVRVTEIEPGSTKSFEDMRGQIEMELKVARAKEKVLDVYDVVEDDRAAGMTLAEIGVKENLPYREIAEIDAQGNGPDGKPITDLPFADDLVTEVFSTDVGVEADPLQTGTEGWTWFDVLDVIAARDRDFEEARGQVAEAWRAQQTRDRIQEKTKEIADKIRSGTDFFTAAEDLGTTSGLFGPANRNATDNVFGSPAIQLMFTTPQGDVTSTAAADAPRRVVFRVIDIDIPKTDEGLPEGLDEQITTGMSNDMLDQYLRELEDRIGTFVNQEALRLALGETGQ
jgi:peptidyl-prolyl cis-trans isomerase D